MTDIVVDFHKIIKGITNDISPQYKYIKKLRQENPQYYEREKQTAKERYQKNKESLIEKAMEYKKNNPNVAKKYRENLKLRMEEDEELKKRQLERTAKNL